MTPRIIIGSLAVAVVIGARAWACYEDRRAKRAAFEFGEQIRTALHGVGEPDETARRERIQQLFWDLMADEPSEPERWAFWEKQLGSTE